MKLTPKQKKFCDEYLIDLNATQAAIRAGYSKKTAKQIATENLSKPYLQEYIKKKQEKLENKTDITLEKIVNAIYYISLDAENINDKLKANDMLMKHLGGYTEDNKLDITAQIKRTIIVNPTKNKSE